MDTKLKKSKPFPAWLCFFLGINLLAFLAAAGILLVPKLLDYQKDSLVFLNGQFKETDVFREDMAGRFDTLVRYTVASEDYGIMNSLALEIDDYKQEGQNLIYWAYNPVTNRKMTNLSKDPVFSKDGQYILPEGYDFYLRLEGNKLYGVVDEKTFDVYRFDNGYRELLSEEFFIEGALDANLLSSQVILAVKRDLEANPYGVSHLNTLNNEYRTVRGLIFLFAGLLLLGLTLLTIAFIKRRAKRECDRWLAKVLGSVWIEIKALITFILFFVSVASDSRVGYANSVFVRMVLTFIYLMACAWWLYLLAVDLINNRKAFFSNNSICWLIRVYKDGELKRDFQKKMIRRIYTLIACEAILVVLTVMAVLARGAAGLFLFILFAGTGLYILYRYLRRYHRNVSDMGLVMDHIRSIKSGEVTLSHRLSPNSDMQSVVDDLGQIQEGIAKAVEERLQSERMKVELITNVSHDLKTPLTSIISYVELISAEENLPANVKDYAAILAQKSERLKSLIQDIFDLSKATSGDIVLVQEKLDLTKLVQQTLADMQEEAQATTLIIKAQYPSAPVFIHGDGKKLYRVFQNLLSNIFKYSLEGSRVYIDFYTQDNQTVQVSLKNIANYEMNFLETEVTERFVRGDQARTTEGSGLGLAIAKSYVEAMNGSLHVKVDGDLFKVIVAFPILRDEAA